MADASCRTLGDGSVSVAMAVHNGADTIDAALESIIEGSHRPDEVVVVDDGSVDATGERLRAAETRWPALLRVIHQPHLGSGAALRTASEHVRGEFLVHADADDVYSPRRIEWSLEMFVETGADMVGGQLVEVLDGLVMRRSDFPVDATERAAHLAAGRDPVAHTVMALRTDGLASFGDYRDLRHAEDLELMLRWARRGARFAVSPRVFGTYRMRRDHLAFDRQVITSLWTRYARHVATIDDDEVPDFDTWVMHAPVRSTMCEAAGRIARRRARKAIASVRARFLGERAHVAATSARPPW